MSEKIRVGVIGCGAGEGHARGYAALPEVELVALAGLDQEHCQEIGSALNIPRLYRDYTELLAQPDIEAVSVCVPNYLHAPVTMAALEAGKHVLVEKPLATTVADGEAMVEAAARTGLILMPVFNYRFRKDSQLFKGYIEDGNLGHIYFARVGWLRQHGIPAGSGSWFVDKNRSGGGCLIDLGVHMLDLSLWLMGQPKVLSVSAATYAGLGPHGRGLWGGKRFAGSLEGFNVEDFVTAFLRLENNATLTLEVSWAGYTHWGDDFFIHLWGEEGGGEMNIFRYRTKDTLRFYKDIHDVRSETRLETEGSHESNMTSEFIRAIRAGQAVSPTVEEGLRILRVIEAIYRSAEEGRQVDLA